MEFSDWQAPPESALPTLFAPTVHNPSQQVVPPYGTNLPVPRASQGLYADEADNASISAGVVVLHDLQLSDRVFSDLKSYGAGIPVFWRMQSPASLLSAAIIPNGSAPGTVVASRCGVLVRKLDSPQPGLYGIDLHATRFSKCSSGVLISATPTKEIDGVQRYMCVVAIEHFCEIYLSDTQARRMYESAQSELILAVPASCAA